MRLPTINVKKSDLLVMLNERKAAETKEDAARLKRRSTKLSSYKRQMVKAAAAVASDPNKVNVGRLSRILYKYTRLEDELNRGRSPWEPTYDNAIRLVEISADEVIKISPNSNLARLLDL
jgi:hypothetical protein